MEGLVRTVADKIGKNSATDVLHVCGTLSEVGVIHLFESFDVVGDGFLKRVGG